MTLIFEYDQQRIHTGRSREIPAGAGAPQGWTRAAPPALDGAQVAQFAAGRWVVLPQRPPADPAPLLHALEEARKAAEAQGVTVNGIRYSGDPSNRAALLEVVQFARESGVTTLTSWKDSDGAFHADHPLADVEQALLAIATRRSALIALEGQYAAQVMDGALTSVEGLDWTV